MRRACNPRATRLIVINLSDQAPKFDLLLIRNTRKSYIITIFPHPPSHWRLIIILYVFL